MTTMKISALKGPAAAPAIALELRGIKEFKAMSEETPCYQAAVYLDGIKVATVRNQGHGGCDFDDWTDKAAEAKVNAYFAAQPTETVDFGHGRTFEHQPTFEMWCHAELQIIDSVKALRRSGARKVLGLTADGKEWAWKATPAQLDQPYKGGTLRAMILAKYPGIKFAHEMSDADLRASVVAIIAAMRAGR